MSSLLKGLFGGDDDKGDAQNAAKEAAATAGAAAANTASTATSPLQGLFGSAEDPAKAKSAAEDFISRVQTGSPHEGFSEQEALTNLATAAKVASPEQIQTATRKAITQLPESDRADFAKMLQQRMGGTGTTSITGGTANAGAASGGTGIDDITGMLGGLLGGSGGSAGGGLGGLLGGLLGEGGGGSTTTNTGAVQGNSGDGGGMGDVLGGILGSPAGKAAVGAIAAMLMKEIMGGNKS